MISSFKGKCRTCGHDHGDGALNSLIRPVPLQQAFDDLQAKYYAVIADKSVLEKAIRETLEENPHLADGDNCTLIKLKRVMGDG